MSEILIENADTHEWEPAVPLPLFISRKFGLVRRYGCICMAEFRTQAKYEDHYRGWHLGVGDGERG